MWRKILWLHLTLYSLIILQWSMRSISLTNIMWLVKFVGISLKDILKWLWTTLLLVIMIIQVLEASKKQYEKFTIFLDLVVKRQIYWLNFWLFRKTLKWLEILVIRLSSCNLIPSQLRIWSLILTSMIFIPMQTYFPSYLPWIVCLFYSYLSRKQHIC